jgi:hypothetical protein
MSVESFNSQFLHVAVRALIDRCKLIGSIIVIQYPLHRLISREFYSDYITLTEHRMSRVSDDLVNYLDNKNV